MHALIDGFHKGRSQIKKRMIDKFYDNPAKPKAACYWGAVYYGLHGKATDKPIIQELVDEGFPELRCYAEPPCDHDLDNAGTIAAIVIHLNDWHDSRQMSEQQITDWLTIALQNNYPSMKALHDANT